MTKQTYFSMPSPSEMDHLIRFCTVMAQSPFYQKLGAGGVMAIYLTAKEYDLPFMACLNGGLHTFDGKVTFAAIMIDALIIKAGHKADLLHLDEESCKIKFTRGDRKNDHTYQPLIYEYTIKQASKAGYLNKKNWQTSPKDMLYSRCITGGGRKHIPEVFVGVLVTGELVGIDADGDVEPLLPPNMPTQLIEDQSSNKISQNNLNQIALDSFDLSEFVFKHKLMVNEDGTCNLLMKYALENAKINEKGIEYLIKIAAKHENTFLERFEVWRNLNHPDKDPLTYLCQVENKEEV